MTTVAGDLAQAFDELRFGRENRLDLRSSLPTAAQAEARAEAWLRERQVAGVREVLVVTGRGRGSVDGVPVVKPTVERLLARLRRRGVVASVTAHTEGAFAVTLAPLTALAAAVRRHRDPTAAVSVPTPAVLDALGPEVLDALRALAVRSLAELGVPDAGRFVEDEMVRQFAALAASVPEGADREARLAAAAHAALASYDDEVE